MAKFAHHRHTTSKGNISREIHTHILDLVYKLFATLLPRCALCKPQKKWKGFNEKTNHKNVLLLEFLLLLLPFFTLPSTIQFLFHHHLFTRWGKGDAPAIHST